MATPDENVLHKQLASTDILQNPVRRLVNFNVANCHVERGH